MNGIWNQQNERQEQQNKREVDAVIGVAERAVDLSKMSADQQAFAAQKDTPDGKKVVSSRAPTRLCRPTSKICSRLPGHIGKGGYFSSSLTAFGLNVPIGHFIRA